MAQEKLNPPSFEEVRRLIDEWSKRDGGIRLSFHQKKDNAYRNISVQDCLHVIETGHLSWPPEWDVQYGNYVYHFGAPDIDEDGFLELIIALVYEYEYLKIVTVKFKFRKG